MQSKLIFGPETNLHTNMKRYRFLGGLKKFVTDTLSTTIKRRLIESIHGTRKCARPRALRILVRHVLEGQGTDTISSIVAITDTKSSVEMYISKIASKDFSAKPNARGLTRTNR